MPPTLCPGDIVIADNLGSRKGRPVRETVRAIGTKLFILPAYGGNLDLIEMVFAKLKTLLRKADERSVKTTCRRIGDLLGELTEDECAAYLYHTGCDTVMARQTLASALQRGAPACVAWIQAAGSKRQDVTADRGSNCHAAHRGRRGQADDALSFIKDHLMRTGHGDKSVKRIAAILPHQEGIDLDTLDLITIRHSED